jgi:hypothetical protein
VLHIFEMKNFFGAQVFYCVYDHCFFLKNVQNMFPITFDYLGVGVTLLYTNCSNCWSTSGFCAAKKRPSASVSTWLP